MYIKVSTGTSFAAAAQYDEAGLSQPQKAQKAGKVEQLATYNLLSTDWRGIAFEMNNVAAFSRTTQPVWNVSLSAAGGQSLTAQQWQQTAEHYLHQIGADPSRHQVAIWRHHDTAHDHVHVLINAVPMDGGPALSRFYNGRRAQRIAEQVDTQLAQPIRKEAGLREALAQTLTTVLRADKPTTLEELCADLRKRGIVAQIKPNAKSPGITFQQGDHQPVKGSRLGHKYSQVMAALAANRAEYEAEIDRLQRELAQKPAVVEVVRPDETQQAEIKQLRLERDEAYAKRTFMQEALLNQPAKTVIKEVEVVREVVKPDPLDQARIEQLTQQVKQNYTAYVQQKQIADRVPELTKSVAELFELNHALQEQSRQQQVRLEQELRRYRELSETWKAHIEKYNELVRRYNEQKERLRANATPTTSIHEPQATIFSQASPTAARVPKVLPVEPNQPATAPGNLDPAWVASMNQRIRQAAKASSNWAQFATNLKLSSLTNPPISRRKGADGKIIYQDKQGQATAAALGFQVGELQRLIEAPVQAQTKGPRLG